MTGFGIKPAGITSAGVGTPLGLPVPGSQGYTQSPDVVAVRAINLRTRDYDTDDSTTAYEHRSMTAQEQLVVIALTETPNRLGYAPTLGDATNGLGLLPTAREARGYVEAALRPYTSQGLIEILGVDIVTIGNVLYRQVRWRDLTVTRTARGAESERTTTTPILT